MDRDSFKAFLRRHRWWIAPIIAAVLLFGLLWWRTRGAELPDYVYRPF